MTYPDYYETEDANKENGIALDDDFVLTEHLRYSAHSYRQSLDENSSAVMKKKYNDYRYSEDSTAHRSSGSGRSNRSGDNNSTTIKKTYSHDEYRYSEDSGRGSNRSNRSNNSNYQDHENSSNYSHSKSGRSFDDYNSNPMERTERTTSTRGSRAYRNTISNHDTIHEEIPTSGSADCEKTIAVFGVNGVTGHYFLQLAVEAGYYVRALILPGFELEDMKENPSLTLIQGTMDDQAKIHRVIRKAAYVVCMLNDCPQMLDTVPPTVVPTHSNYQFIQKLVPLMSRCSNCQVLLYQATSFARDTQGPAPVITNMMKKMSVRKTRREMLTEQDKIVKFISKYQKAKAREDGGNPFNYIITRPSELVWDRPSKKKLEASKSLPGPFPITNIDLAEFSLNALKSEKLYNTCPYVVQDGI